MRYHSISKLPLSWLCCPFCKSELEEINKKYICKKCNGIFKIKDNIPIFLSIYPFKKYQLYKTIDSVWSRHEAWRDFVYRSPRIRDFMSFLNNYEKLFYGKVLEIGAGSCALGSIIKLNKSIKITSTDVSLNAIKLNIKTAEFIANKSNHYVVCDSEKLPFKDKLFDCVFGSSIIHHFIDTQKFLKEVIRVLKPNGYYIGISEPACSKVFAPFYRSTSNSQRYAKLGIPKKVIGVNEYKKEFFLAGFKNIKIRHCKNIMFHTYTQTTIIYYLLTSWVPKFIINKFFYTEIHIVARK